MKMDEMVRLAFGNLWKMRLRTILTVLGVVIGIGALVSMVSFGTGMQKNVTEAFLKNDLFTSLQVLPRKIDLDEVMHGDPQSALRRAQSDSVILDEKTLKAIQSIPQVELAYPEIRFPVKVRFQGNEVTANVRAMPAVMGTGGLVNRETSSFLGSITKIASLASP